NSGTLTVRLTNVANGFVVADAIRIVAATADVVKPTADILDVLPDPRITPVPSVTIRFSEPVAGLDLPDLSLTRNAAPNPPPHRRTDAHPEGQQPLASRQPRRPDGNPRPLPAHAECRGLGHHRRRGQRARRLRRGQLDG